MINKIIKVIFVLLIIYIATWMFFVSDGCIPTGINLDKKDWLSFWGEFLGFAGTALLGYVALLQTKRADEINERLIKLEKSEYMPALKATKFMGISKFEISEIGKQQNGSDIFVTEMKLKDGNTQLGYAISLLDKNFNSNENSYIRTYELHFTYFSKALLGSVIFETMEFSDDDFIKKFVIGKTIDISLSNEDVLKIFVHHVSNNNHLEEVGNNESNLMIKSTKMIFNLTIYTVSGEKYSESITINKHLASEEVLKDGESYENIETMISSSLRIEMN